VGSVKFVGVGSTRLPLRAFSGALAAIAAAALAAPATAPAITRTVDYGQPGPAQMRAVRGWWNPNGGTLRMPARYVSRTTMSPRTQTICTEFTLYRFTAEYFEEPWAFEATSRSCETAAPGRRAHFPTWRYSALAYSSYSLDVTITWRVRGGDRLASALYDYDRVADYRCQTRNCSSAIRQRGVASIRFDS
jgi:hypothetical protein